MRQLGFEFVVGVRSTRRTMHPGEVTVSDCPHGGYVELKNWPHDTLALGRIDRGDRTFHAVSSELMEGDKVVAEGKARWNEESFFKEGKHQFGLAQFATRTEVGLDRWVLLVFLAWTLAILHRDAGMTLEVCAMLALVTVMPQACLSRLLKIVNRNADFLAQHGYSLHYARCKLLTKSHWVAHSREYARLASSAELGLIPHHPVTLGGICAALLDGYTAGLELPQPCVLIQQSAFERLITPCLAVQREHSWPPTTSRPWSRTKRRGPATPF